MPEIEIDTRVSGSLHPDNLPPVGAVLDRHGTPGQEGLRAAKNALQTMYEARYKVEHAKEQIRHDGSRTEDGQMQGRLSCSPEVGVQSNGKSLIYCEPPRDSWRLQTLRRWSHENDDEIFPGSAGTGGAAGVGTPVGISLTVGCDGLDCREDRLHAGDAAPVGAAVRA